MHHLPCPHCDSAITVSPVQAGETTGCPQCGASIPVPRLGELKKLPRANEPARPEASETSAGLRGSFVALALIATASGLIAVFCGLRWALIEVPLTTEQHIAELRAHYSDASAARLIREWENIEQRDIEMLAPYDYRTTQQTKQQWGRSGLIAATVCLFALVGAVALAIASRSERPVPRPDT